MAAVSEGVQATQSVLDFVGQIHDRFTASDQYRSKAAVLQAKLDSLKQDDSIQLLPDSGTTRQTLRKAESALKTAQARLNSWEERVDSSQSCLQCIWWLSEKLAFALCPLQNALKELDEDLETIPKLVDEENKSADRRRKADISTRVHDNNKYVPIEESQREVIKAIEDTQGPPLILLYGGVGKGKSTLARYMCKRYGKSGEMSSMFDHVIVVSCSNSSASDSVTKQYEILDKHSVSSLIDETSLKSEKPDSGKTIDPKSRIQEALQKYFLHKKILMVLDDVSDAGFLDKMWMAARDGKDDKILITSQKWNLCDAFPQDFVAIPMRNPSREEARKILASLVGLENNTIPHHLLDIANKMVKATDGNPLALSCLASAFSYGQDRKGRSEWQDAWNELSTQLGHTETSFVLAQNDQIAPPRSLWSAMKLCIESLETRDANRILLLMYACEGGAVPEGVLRILCAGLQISSTAFNKSRDELVMRELLKHPADKLTSKTNLSNELNKEELQESPTWSLQSLVKLYMERNVGIQQQMASLISASLAGDAQFSQVWIIKSKQECGTEIVEMDRQTLRVKRETSDSESDEETRVRIMLCALYFDCNLIDQGVTRAVIEACERSNIDAEDSGNKLRRKAIQPLLWLLEKREEQFGVESDEELGEGTGDHADPELGEQWSKEDKCRVRKVLLRYICKRQLDAENISCLLKVAACPSAQLATLKALTHMLSIEEGPLLNENTLSFLPTILDFFNLKEDFHGSVQEAASKALATICWKAAYDKSTLLVANGHGVLDVLKQSLDSNSVVFSQNGANALSGLALPNEIPIAQIIMSKPGILASLVNCLYDESKPRLQITAVGAFSNLCRSKDDLLRSRIVCEEGPLVGLVHCLSKHDSDDLRRLAAHTLGNLASGTDDSLKLRIASEEGALVGLVNCLSKHDNDNLLSQAARALGNLAATKDDSLRMRITTEEGALVGLVHCLSKHDNDTLREIASRALGNLAVGNDARKLRISSEEGAMVGLVHCLSKHDNDALREVAVHTLGNLAAVQDEFLKLRIVSEEGALVGLVNCLSKHDNDQLQEKAAGTLGNLAGVANVDSPLRLRIASEEGALAGLVNCLSKHDNDNLQKVAAQTLGSLAAANDDSVRWRIVSEEGSLIGLVNCLLKHDNDEVRVMAADALGNLAFAKDDSLKWRIANEEGALVGLVDCLSKHDNDNLREPAARALGNLTYTKDNLLEWRIASEEGALVGIVNCLSKHDNDKLRLLAARFLANVALADDVSLLLIIPSVEGALAGLVNCLSKHDNEELQLHAATTLMFLSGVEDDSLKLRIATQEGALVGLVNCGSQSEAGAFLAALAVEKLNHSPDARPVLRGTEGLMQLLTSLVGDDVHASTRCCAVTTLFNLDPTRAQEMGLLSARLDVSSLSHRIFVKAKLGDFQGALDDGDEAVQRSETETDDMKAFVLQERGVLKRMMGDLEGALTDLDEGLKLQANDYDKLKHRGYVKFLLDDVEGARADAELALSRESSRGNSDCYLGGTAAEYLGYKL